MRPSAVDQQIKATIKAIYNMSDVGGAAAGGIEFWEQSIGGCSKVIKG